MSIRTKASGAAAAQIRDTVLDMDLVAINAEEAMPEPVELFDLVEAPVADTPRAYGMTARRGRPWHVADAPGLATDDNAGLADQRKNTRSSVLGRARARPTAMDLR